jgi:hypothetical protein
MRIQEFNYSVNLLQAILWQYDEATNLLSLINQKQVWYNKYQTQFWTDWYTNVFNLLTANQFGLSLWSYILNVPLFLDNVQDDPDKPVFGFNNNDSFPTLENTYLNFNNGNFSTKGQTISLTIEEQRFILRLRYFQLSNNGTTININVFLKYLLESSDIGYNGTIYVLDGLDMTITYVITDAGFPQELLDAIQLLDLFPRPTGVGIKIHINYGVQFGFNNNDLYPILENTNQNFGLGNFVNPFITSPNPIYDFDNRIMADEDGTIMVDEDNAIMITE